MQTALLTLLGLGLLTAMGVGPTLLAFRRERRRQIGLLFAPVGLGCFLFVTHFLAAFGLRGTFVVLLAAILLLGLSLGVALCFLKSRRSQQRQGSIRQQVPIAAAVLASLVIHAWPLYVAGYDSFCGFGNPDAAFTIAAFEGIAQSAYGSRPQSGPQYWPHAQFAHLFGAAYLAVFVSFVTGIPIRYLHDTTAATLLGVAPLSAAAWFIAAYGPRLRTAAIAGIAVGVSSVFGYTFHLQSLGALSLMALGPGILALWLMGIRRNSPVTVALCCVLFAGACFAYYAALPFLLTLLLAASLPAFIAGRKRRYLLVAGLAGLLSLGAAAFPSLWGATIRRTFEEALSGRLRAGPDAPEAALAFAPMLTESVFPFIWGLLIPQPALSALFQPGSWLWWCTLALACGLTLVLASVLARMCPRLALGPNEVVAASWSLLLFYLFFRNGYGVLKIVGWSSPFWLTAAVDALYSSRRNVFRSRAGVPLRWVLALGWLACNLFWGTRLATISLNSEITSPKPLRGFSLKDLADLESAKQLIGQGETILLLPDPVVQRWVLTFLRHTEIAVLPFLPMFSDEIDPHEPLAASGSAKAQLVLTWAKDEDDIIVNRRSQPIWQSDKFALYRLTNLDAFLACGRGWYGREPIRQFFSGEKGMFRWLRRQGDLVAFTARGGLYRLTFKTISAPTLRSHLQTVAVSVNGVEVDKVPISDYSNVLSHQFRLKPGFNTLALRVEREGSSVPRQFGLVNHWVPLDYRRLSIAVFDVQLIGALGVPVGRIGCGVDRSSWLVGSPMFVMGMYTDGWIGSSARFLLRRCGDVLVIDGFVPGAELGIFPVPIDVWIDDFHIGKALVKQPGRFSLAFSVRENRSSNCFSAVRVEVGKLWRGGRDPRQLSLRMERIGFRQSPSN